MRCDNTQHNIRVSLSHTSTAAIQNNINNNIGDITQPTQVG